MPKIRHIYTVVREFNVPAKELQEEIENLGHIRDEAGEYLYGGCADKEEIKVAMMVQQSDKQWKVV